MRPVDRLHCDDCATWLPEDDLEPWEDDNGAEIWICTDCAAARWAELARRSS